MPSYLFILLIIYIYKHIYTQKYIHMHGNRIYMIVQNRRPAIFSLRLAVILMHTLIFKNLTKQQSVNVLTWSWHPVDTIASEVVMNLEIRESSQSQFLCICKLSWPIYTSLKNRESAIANLTYYKTFQI